MAHGMKNFGTGPRGGGSGSIGMEKVRAKDTKATVIRIIDYLGSQKRILVIATLMVALSTVLGLLGPYFISRAIDEFITKDISEGFVGFLLLMSVVYILSATINYLQNFIFVGISQKAVKDIRQDFFARMMKNSLSFFDRTPNGELMSRLTNDIENIGMALSQNVSQMMSSIFTLIGVLIIMYLLNWQMALVTTITVPLLLFTAKTIAKHSRKGFRAKQRHLGTINGMIEETLSGQKVVKVYGKEQDVIESFDVMNQNLKEASIKAEVYGGFMGPSMNMNNQVRFAVIVTVGGILALNGLTTVGIIAAFISYSKRFGRPLSQLATVYNTIQAAVAGAERVFETMDHEPEIQDVEGAIDVASMEGHVRFEAVDFGYVEEVQVLKNATFEAKPGETIAIVGPTGAGKTTIINLLTRFYDINSGVISIDGIDIKRIKKDDLRRQLGIVLQDTYLFSDTVMENIRYGKLGATDEEVREAARLAYADHFIKNLPEGYETHLSQEGSNLSQGQRQLIAIARAILSDPAILILDEATSSVDTRTEVHIQKAMLRLMEGRTSFVIAHRLSTIKDADMIMVIKDGEIIERGTHEALITMDGFYNNLHASQYRNLA